MSTHDLLLQILPSVSVKEMLEALSNISDLAGDMREKPEEDPLNDEVARILLDPEFVAETDKFARKKGLPHERARMIILMGFLAGLITPVPAMEELGGVANED